MAWRWRLSLSLLAPTLVAVRYVRYFCRADEAAGMPLVDPEGDHVARLHLMCALGITQGVLVEQIMAAASPARTLLVIHYACRDNPLGDVCPGVKGKKLSFTRIVGMGHLRRKRNANNPRPFLRCPPDLL
jgi:hypothetical protein